MKKTIRKKNAPLPSFECGQVWQMVDSSLRIELVGKRLVHYKHYNLRIKRPNVLLSNKAVLERFLQERRAILLPEAPQLTAVSRTQVEPRRQPSRRTAAKEA